MSATETRRLRIGELAERTGVPPRTIRYYAEIGLLHCAKRRKGEHRTYDESDADRILQLTRLRDLLGLSLDELCGDRRSQNIVYPRQVAMYLSRELTDSSLPKIGKEFGGRDHTTVIHATSKIARLIREDRSVYNLVHELTARIKQGR